MIQRPRGTRDFSPEEMEKRRYLESEMREEAKKFAFREIATPIFEHTELFTLKSGPAIIEEIYAFRDKGGREISLRPELTAPVIRFFVNELSSMPKPLKLFYFGPCFRYERPQSGRFREFYQFGAELIGAENPESDAEVIALAVAIMRRVGLSDINVRVGHIGILREMLVSSGVSPESASRVLQRLDRKEYAEARAAMEESGMEDSSIDEVIRITQVSGDVGCLSDLEGDAISYLRELLLVLEAYGMGDITVDLGVVRGLDYYTGIVFEIDAPRLGAEKQVCGGGSYSLSELFGGERVFSTGFAIGFDRMVLALEKEGFRCPSQSVEVFVMPVGEERRWEAFPIVSALRGGGIVTEIDLMRRSMGRGLKHADALGAAYTVIIGEKELEQDSVTVRDMHSGEQVLVAREKLLPYLRAKLGKK